MYVTLNSALIQADLIIPVTGKQTHIRLTVNRAAILSLTFLRTGVHFCTLLNTALQPTVLRKALHKCQRMTWSSAPPWLHTEVEKNQQTVSGCTLDTSTYLPWLSLSYLVLTLHPRGHQELEVELTVHPWDGAPVCNRCSHL